MTKTRMSAEEYINLRGGFAGMEPPASKYRNKPTVVDGIRFDSKAEARRWDQLRMMEKAGEITDLKRQVSYALTVNGKLVGRYVGDFQYALPSGDIVTEDVKGVETPVFRLKSKIFSAIYGRDIAIIGGKK